MTSMTIYQIFEYFLIYSLFGWIIEVIYQAVSKGIVVNRGFLNGPICPIYGFGVISIISLVNMVTKSQGHPENGNPIIILIIGIIIATIIELIGGWALDKIFHARWWDYSDRKFNLNGYICPQFSLRWGLGILLVIKVVHPIIQKLSIFQNVSNIDIFILLIFYLLLIVDLCISVSIIIGLNKQFTDIDVMRKAMRTVSNKISTEIGEHALDAKQKSDETIIQATLLKYEIEDDAEELRDKIDEKMEMLKSKISKNRFIGSGRIFKAYPNIKIRDFDYILNEIKSRIKK